MLDCAVITRKDRFWLPQSVSIPMIRQVLRLTRDFTLTSDLLGVTIKEAQAAYEDWDKAPVMHGYKMPDHKKAWQRRELIILGQMWNRGAQAEEIAKVLKRSRSSVSGKRRSLGLPHARRSHEKSPLNMMPHCVRAHFQHPRKQSCHGHKPVF